MDGVHHFDSLDGTHRSWSPRGLRHGHDLHARLELPLGFISQLVSPSTPFFRYCSLTRQCRIRFRCQHNAPIPRRRVLPALCQTDVQKPGRAVGRNIDRMHCYLDDSDSYCVPSLRTEASTE